MPADIKIQWSGLSNQFKPAAETAINKILADPDIRDQIDFKVSGTLTFKFGVLTGINQNALAVSTGLDTANPSITFNLGKGFGFVNNDLVFAPGASDQKSFAANAVHEVMHVGYPQLTGKGTFHNSNTPATTDLEKGQDAAGELAFRLLTTSATQKIFGFVSPDEQAALTLAKNELDANPYTKDVDWDAVSGSNVRILLVDKQSWYTQYLPPNAKATDYDSGQMNDSDGLWQIEQNGDGVSVTTTYDQFNNFSWDRQIERIIDNGPVNKIVVGDNEQVVSATQNGAQLAGDIGAYFGSKLGQTLGGNSLAGKLAAGSVLGAVGKEVGAALTMGASFSLDLAVKDAFGTLVPGGTSVGALPSGAIATVSSLLMAELAQKLDLHGVGAGLFNAVGTTITTKLITNAYGVMTGATYTVGNAQVPVEMFTGFDPVSLAGNVGGAVGGYLGSTLAANIMMPQHAEGATGESIGCGRASAQVGLPKVARGFDCNRLWIIKPKVGTRPRTRCQRRVGAYRPVRGDFRDGRHWPAGQTRRRIASCADCHPNTLDCCASGRFCGGQTTRPCMLATKRSGAPLRHVSSGTHADEATLGVD